MVKFKKGDRVKALVNGVDYKIGDEFVLTADGDDKSVYFDDNVGDDRIRPQEEFELLPIAVATGAVDNKSALQIEAGKYYLTSGGLRVGPMEPWPLGGWHVAKGLFSGGLWNRDGTAWYKGAPDSPDLIAEWVDGPVTQDTNDDTPPVAEQQEARRFKVGDKVRSRIDYLWVEAGAEYIVNLIDRDGDVWLKNDDGDVAYMTDDEVELITPVEEAQKLTSADGRTIMDVTNGVLTMEADKVDVPASSSGEVTLKLSLGTSEITEAIKSTLLRTKQGYGFEIARHGDYVWVDTGLNAPIAFKATNVKAA